MTPLIGAWLGLCVGGILVTAFLRRSARREERREQRKWQRNRGLVPGDRITVTVYDARVAGTVEDPHTALGTVLVRLDYPIQHGGMTITWVYRDRDDCQLMEER